MKDKDQGPRTITIGLKNFLASALTWAAATCFCKLSILFLYLELFPARKFRYVVFVMIGFVAAFGIGLILTGLLICTPIAFNWDKGLQGHCGSTVDEEIYFTAVNMVIDGLIVFLPTPVVWRLQMPIKKKVMVSSMFSLGLVICVLNAAKIGIVCTNNAADFTYTLSDVAILGGLEIWFGIVAACLPTLKPIFTRRRKTTNIFPPSGYQDLSYKHTRSNARYPDEGDFSWELKRMSHKKQRDKPSEIDIPPLYDDDLPLRDGLTFPEKAKKHDNTRVAHSQ
ncbi:MAG: hypothetical protein Q9219_007439 [cf. Caloplaca sp. 3 TL-2023]